MTAPIKLIYGVGINDSDYAVEAGGVKCVYYKTWFEMLRRGHSSRYKTDITESYKDVSVCKEWHLFSNFKAWMETQVYEGLALDKDILIPGNKIYRPDVCIFVPSRVNSLLLDGGAKTRGATEYPLGVHYKRKEKWCNKERQKPYVAQVNVLGKKSQKHLGYFRTPEEAHKAWQLAKAGVIEDVVSWWATDSSVSTSFSTKAADALLDRAWGLRYNASLGIINESI